MFVTEFGSLGSVLTIRVPLGESKIGLALPVSDQTIGPPSCAPRVCTVQTRLKDRSPRSDNRVGKFPALNSELCQIR